MANKYLLIPEHLYRGLTEDHSSNINLDFEKKQLEKTKKLPRKDRTAKNIAYNQELGRYLKMKKEHDNKPIKVVLENGATVIAKRNRKGKRPSKTSSRRTSITGDSEYKSTRDEDEYDEEEEEEEEKVDNTMNWDFGHLNFGHNDGEEEEEKLVQRIATPKRRKYAMLDRNPAMTRLYEIITAAPQKFGVTNKGLILNKYKQPMPDSNLLESITRIINPKLGEASPKGTSQLATAIKKNPITNRIYEEGLAFRQGQSYKLSNISQNPIKYEIKFNNPQAWNK